MFLKGIVVCFVGFIQLAHSLKLPSYIKPCARNDPNLNECATRNGRLAIPGFINGDRKYRIPNLNPLYVPEIKINEGIGIKIVATDARIYNLDKAQLKSVKIDNPNKKMEISLFFPQAIFLSKYTLSGRILVLPITGNGNCNLTLDNLAITYTFNYDLVRKGPKREEYIKAYLGKANYKTTRVYVQLDNLFNGDKRLGQQMNQFLNQNWREVGRELGPAIAQAVAQVAHSILVRILDLLPYNEIMPEHL